MDLINGIFYLVLIDTFTSNIFINCLTCAAGLTKTCQAVTSCAVFSSKSSISYVCSANTCEVVLTTYPVSQGYTVSCCTTDNCNSYKPVGNKIQCYDGANNKCDATGSCYVINDGHATYRGCSELSCSEIQNSYTSNYGYNSYCCATSLCNSNTNSTFINSGLKLYLSKSNFVSILVIYFFVFNLANLNI